MAGSKSAYLEAALLNWLLGAAAAPAPGASLYVALSTAAFTTAATGAAMTEVSGGAYARVAVTRNTTNFPAATGSNPASINNATAITFPAATASWGTVTSFYIVDAATGGNIYYGADLTTAKAVNTGDTATFAASALTATEQ